MENNNKSIFLHRNAVIATMHKKEQVIAPILEKELGLNIVVPENFNSDIFGTFTNEVGRAGDQLEAARKKVDTAMLKSGLNIGIASEGSFGPHPMFPFVPFNRELILFVDKKLELEITGYVANTDTNYAQKEVESFEEAYEFAQSIGFPEHGVIIKKYSKTTNSKEIIKGITNVEQLMNAISSRFSQTSNFMGKIFIETDMRAMFNPTRMKNIQLATIDLINNINSLCPNCETPGFKIIEVKKGLPCEYCGIPTDVIQSQIYECKKCKHQKKVKFPSGKAYADPTYCNICNP